MDERDQRKQIKKLRFVKHCYAAKTSQVTGQIWGGFTPCQLDFGGCCGSTAAAAWRRPHVGQGNKSRDIYMYFLLTDCWIDYSLPGAEISTFENSFSSPFAMKNSFPTGVSMTLLLLILTCLLPLFHFTHFLLMQGNLSLTPAQRVFCLLQLNLWKDFLDPYHGEHLFPQVSASK